MVVGIHRWSSCTLRTPSAPAANSCRKVSCLGNVSSKVARTQDCHIQLVCSRFLTKQTSEEIVNARADYKSLTLADCTEKVLIYLVDCRIHKSGQIVPLLKLCFAHEIVWHLASVLNYAPCSLLYEIGVELHDGLLRVDSGRGYVANLLALLICFVGTNLGWPDGLQQRPRYWLV